MEFLPASNGGTPKNLYPCLATITLSGPTQLGRRGSTKGDKIDEEDANPLMRAISGNRRRTSFGVAAERVSGEERRKSFAADASGTTTGAGTGAASGGVSALREEGTWYWRVRAGATEGHLVLLPLSEPVNSLLTTPPAPLSHAMPAHSKQHSATSAEARAEEGSGLVGKVKSIFNRRGSKADAEHAASAGTTGRAPSDAAVMGPTSTTGGAGGDQATTASAHTDTTAVDSSPAQGAGQSHGQGGEPIADITSRGEQRPSATAMAAGATNMNGSAELGWPGMVQGQKLGAVVVSLAAVRKEDVKVGGGKKGEGSWVTVPVHASNALPGVGSHLSDLPKSGTIKFEFDKEWIGAKDEAELLHHHIVQAIDGGSSSALSHADGIVRPAQPASVQLGQ